MTSSDFPQPMLASPAATEGSISTDHPPEHTNVKCVFVGDSGIGKSSLLVSYTTNGFLSSYHPTTFDTYSVDVQVDYHWYHVSLCDTPGLDHFEQIRPLAYPEAHVFLLCFAVANPASLHSLRTKWLAELKEHANPNAAWLLIGLKSDQRDDASVLLELSTKNEGPVTREEAERVCKELGAIEYVECSALTQKNLKDVFDLAIWAAVRVLENQNASIKNGKKGKNKKKGHKVSDKSNKKMISADKQGAAPTRKVSGWRKLFCIGDHSAG